MTVIRFDRRADHFIESKPRALDRDMDIVALTAELGRHLERAHQAFWRNDAQVSLDALSKANERRIAIRVIAEADAARIEAAPVIHTQQRAAA